MKIVWLSDLDIIGSGYKNISIPLCQGLAELGHDVKVVGLNYKREEHFFKFSMLPANNLQEATATIHNLRKLTDFDILVVALDIPLQETILRSYPDREFKYVGIFPVESAPLTFSWSFVLNQMDKPLVISGFGAEAAVEAGVMKAEHLPICVDTKSWRPPTEEERKFLRTAFGFEDDTFVVFTVADNQERKFLSRAMEIFSGFTKQHYEKSVYMLVTREHSPFGWRLKDYARTVDIESKFMVFERGMPFDDLWALYAVADCFLLTSKCEGLGMPILEAMACGVPCVATNCTGMKESLSDDRGFLIEHDDCDPHIDPFGNSRRYFCKIEDGIEKLRQVWETEPDTSKALEYVRSRNWSDSIKFLDEKLKELLELQEEDYLAVI